MKTRTLIAAIAIMAALPIAPALAVDQSGQFTELSGEININRGPKSFQASLGAAVMQDDIIETGKDGKGTILFKNGSVLRLGPSSNITITKLVYDADKGKSEMGYELAYGSIMNIVGSIFGDDESSYEVTTPTGVAGVRGTIFIIDVTKPSAGRAKTTTVGIEGQVVFTDFTGNTVVIGPNQFSSTADNGMAGQPVQIEAVELKGLMDKVTVSPSRNNVNPINNQRKASDLNVDPPEKKEFQPFAVNPSGLGAVGGGDAGDVPNPVQFPTGDNPEDLIFQEPPSFTEIELIINFTP